MGNTCKMGLVKLYNGPKPTVCKCGNWRMHFNNNSTQWIIWCAEVSCNRIAVNGSLVQLHEKGNAEIFVVPLCSFHEQETNVLDIGDAIPINTIILDCAKCKTH
ncbi:MAG TPA: hypothetical protein DCP55_06245 [Chitinophagaceae bacterium]|jgi:hypothetical protein|nr:hypothetical protein [Chitinophagaceae bacterium]NBY24966.1 hypothetical protein [Chitinophagaceae bacterium]NDE78642.1 hypothetical protein [Chitinophagaceae bacterium]HAL95526.1 hypothetical protein [Chitinophagaceae bacterium]